MKLTAEAVKTVFFDCLFREGEDASNAVKAEGIIVDVGFHPERLKLHTAEIGELLEELPDQFHEGWSFLQACNDKDGNQWGDHQHMEQLFLLGLAAGKVECMLPRGAWPALPGGMPYYRFTK